jgi:prepilin-type processing-associated H-X9-DG protein
MRRGNERSGPVGLTLIEVLVVVAIVALLIALSLPAVVAARASARRAICANNLKQLGVAIFSYESGANCFPPGQNGQNYYSMFASILQQLEQTPLYNSINFQIRSSSPGPANLTVSQTQLSVLLCPADLGPQNNHAWTNYAGNEGFDLQGLGFNGSFVPTSGNLFIRLKPPPIIGPRDFTDGTSSTVAMSEWRLGPANVGLNDALRSIYETARLPAPEQFDDFISACLNHPPDARRMNNRGMIWFTGATSRTLYNHNLRPNDVSCANGFNPTLGAITAGSQHPGAVNALFADGHVSPVLVSVSISIWRAIATRNGGEVISMP